MAHREGNKRGEETRALETGSVTSLIVSDIITKGPDTSVTSELVFTGQPQDM